MNEKHYRSRSVAETLAALDRMNDDHAQSERWAEPLRRKLQSRQLAESQWARDWLAKHGLAENDLCTAWHHLPRQRRDRLRDAFRAGEEVRPC